MEATGDKQLQGSYITQELLKELNKVGNRLLIGIPCERKEGEKRLALTPEAVDMLTDRGHRVLVESGSITPIITIPRLVPRLLLLRPKFSRLISF